MKNVRFIIFLLLVPFAFLLASCDNSVPAELQMEVVSIISMEGYSEEQILAGIEYFDLWIYEEPGNAGTDDIVPTQPVQPIDDSEIVPPVFEGRLYRDGYLRVENLDPGKYYIEARAGGDPDICEFVSVVVQGSNMDEYGNIIVERGVPVLIKLLVSYDRH
ncbi:MAG: hypothetical protein IKI90_05610 [Treponema sp.]|nr:hypothetical protein [Treponema sp.]